MSRSYPIRWQGVEFRGSALYPKTFYAKGASGWDTTFYIIIFSFDLVFVLGVGHWKVAAGFRERERGRSGVQE